MALTPQSAPLGEDPVPAASGIASPCGNAGSAASWLGGHLTQCQPWAVFAIAALLALFYLHHTGYLHLPMLYEEPDIGRHLAYGDGFLSPYDPQPDAPPTSWSPPVYPLLVAAAFRVFGMDSTGATVAMAMFTAACYGLVASGLFILGKRLFHPAAGLIAAALFIAHPMFLRLTGRFWDAYPALAMFIWLIVAAVAIRQSRPTPWRMLALGCGLGVLALTNASYVLTFPVILLLAASGMDWSQAIQPLLLGSLAFLLTLTPWTLRNYHQFHRLFYVRGGAWMELWFGNEPGQSGWINDRAFADHPGHSTKERHKLLAWGETRYFDYCKQRFWQNYHADPAAFWKRSAARLAYVFLSDPTDPAHFPMMPDRKWHGIVIIRLLVNGLITTLGLAGAWAAWRLRYPGPWIILLGVLSVAPFVAAGVWDRHTMPLRALLLLLTGFLIWATWHRLHCATWPDTHGGRSS